MIRGAVAVIVALLVAGCGLAEQQGPAPAIALGPLGPLLPGAKPDSPPIECRAVPVAQCVPAGNVDDAGVAVEKVARVVVSCESRPCDDTNGAFRVDVVGATGGMQQIARGVYGDAEQPRYPAPPDS